MMRRVGRAGREVNEGRFVRRQGLRVLDPGPRLLRHVGHEVVVRVVGQFDLRDAVVQVRRPLVRLAPEETVELVEALARGPAVIRPRDAGFPGSRLMPLAEGAGRIAVEPQRLGERRGRVRDLAGGAREAGRHLGNEGHVDRVVVAAALERRARRRGKRRRVEVVVAQPVLREAVERLGLDGPAERTGRAEAQVVDQHDDHVGRALRGLDVEGRRHLRLARVNLGIGRPLGLGDRQHGAVERRLGGARGGADGAEGQAEGVVDCVLLHVLTPIRPPSRISDARAGPGQGVRVFVTSGTRRRSRHR